jgi:O-antigen ligase
LRSLTGNMIDWKYQMTVWFLFCITLMVLLLGVYNSTLSNKSIFYAIVVSNILLVGYLVLLRAISLGILIYLYSLTFLNYYWRFVVPGRWPDIDIPRMMFIFIWMVILVETMVGARKLLPRTSTETAMIVMVVGMFGIMLTVGTLNIRQFLNGYGIPFAMFVCAKNTFTSRKDLERFLLWLAVPLSIYFPVNQFFEHYRMTQFVFPTYILSPVIAGTQVDWGDRAMGAFLQPVATGTAIVSIYILSMYRLSHIRGFLSMATRLFITVATPIAIFFTYTRAVYLGYFAALMVYSMLSKRHRVLGILVIFALLITVFANWSKVTSDDRTAGGMAAEETAAARLVLVSVSMKMFADRPFVGVGFTNFTKYAPAYARTVRSTMLGFKESWVGQQINQHNYFLTVLTELGLVGFVPLVLIFYTLLRTLYKARFVEAANYDSDFVVAVWGVWTVYLINIFFIEPRFFEFMNALPYIFAGIVVGGYQRAMLQRESRIPEGERS